MGIQIRKALTSDLDAVAAIYDRVHDAQDSGQLTTGWIRGVYPTRATALAALDRGTCLWRCWAARRQAPPF